MASSLLLDGRSNVDDETGDNAVVADPALQADSALQSSRSSALDRQPLQQQQPAEEDGCALHTDDHEGPAATKRRSTTSHYQYPFALSKSCSGAKDDDDDFCLTSLELFSDLAVVVAIHFVSECLEEQEGWFLSLPWYFINVFQLWLVWHVAMIGFHVSHLFQDKDNALHYVVVVTFMVLVLVMAGAQAAGRSRAALIDFMILRVFEVGVLWLQVQRDAPEGFDATRLAVLRSIPNTMIPWVLFGEILPLSLALYLSPDDGGETPYLPLVYLSFFLVVMQRTYGAYKGDRMQQRNLSSEDNFAITHVFSPSLLKERYELVVLIFIGEVTFGATAGMKADEFTFVILAISAVLSAFGCYLLCFRAQPLTSQSFWKSSGLRIITGQHFYAGLLSVTPGIAAGYIVIGEAIVEQANAGEGNEGYCNLKSSILLSWSVAAFLIFSGLIHCMHVSPKDETSHRIRKEVRGGLWLFFLLIFIAMALWNNERWMCFGSIPVMVVLCPFLLIICACIEVWGSRGKDDQSFLITMNMALV